MRLCRCMRLSGFLMTLVTFASLQAQVTGLEGWDIFLDPGHSKKENMGIYGYSEAEKNLRVGLHLRDLLRSKTDIDTVFMCRTNDVQDVELTQRDDLANNAYGVGQPASWYHSIHSNAPSTTANSVLMLWGQHYSGAPYYGMEKIPNGGRAMSDIMAPLLARGMRTSPYTSIGDCSYYTWSDWCEQSGGPYLHVNRTTVMPSELSEAGFHTNPIQNQRNMNEKWRRLEAYTFFWSLLKYHSLERPRVRILTGIIYDLESDTPVNGAVATAAGIADTTDTYESLFYKYSGDPDLLHNGFFFLEDLPEDTVELVISAPGYYPDTLQVGMVDTFFTFRDVQLISSVPPFVVSSTPAPGDTVFPAWNPIVVAFSRPMNQVSVETTFVAPGDVGGTFSWADGNRKMTFHPDSLLAYLTDYTLTISGQARDAYGHPFDGNADGTGGDSLVISFRTGPADQFPPAVVYLYPAALSTGIELQPLVNLVFDETIDAASLYDGIVAITRLSDQHSVAGQLRHYVVGAQSTLNFFPTEQLSANQRHTINILPGLRDLLGNEQISTRSFRFTTGDLLYDVTSIDRYDGGIGNWTRSQFWGGIATGNSEAASQAVVNLLTSSTTSFQFNYAWDTTATDWFIREWLKDGTAPKTVHFTSDYILQAYLFGDGSGNLIRFCVDDKVPNYIAANHEVSPWFSIDWIGWRLVSWDLSAGETGTWADLGDGNLDGTLGFDSFQLTYALGAAPAGTIYIDDLRLAQARPLAISEAHASLPLKFALYPNFPNPFNPATTIAYDVPRTAKLRLTIYNLRGQPVRTLVQGLVEVGRHRAVWDGKDRHGRQVASGIYIVRLEVEGFAQSRKLVLAR